MCVCVFMKNIILHLYICSKSFRFFTHLQTFVLTSSAKKN